MLEVVFNKLILPTANAHHQFILWLHKWFFITSKITIIFAQGTLIDPIIQPYFSSFSFMKGYIFKFPVLICIYICIFLFFFHLANIYLVPNYKDKIGQACISYLMSNYLSPNSKLNLKISLFSEKHRES